MLSHQADEYYETWKREHPEAFADWVERCRAAANPPRNPGKVAINQLNREFSRDAENCYGEESG